MSRHWNPDEDVARVRSRAKRQRLPEGAVAGLVLVAGACIGLSILLYNVAGPRDVFTP